MKMLSFTICNLEELLPWSDALPDACRVNVKESNVKPPASMYTGKKGPLHQALSKLLNKYRAKESPYASDSP